jgi:hypothetical protein
MMTSLKTLFDADAVSPEEATWMTDISTYQNPSSLTGIPSSKLEVQLQFLAKELELERMRRQKLE